MSIISPIVCLESISADEPVADPFFLKGSRRKPCSQVYIYRRVRTDWFSFSVHPMSDLATRTIRWLVSSKAFVNGASLCAEWESDRADLEQMFWLTRHGLKQFFLENGQAEMPPVDGGSLYPNREAAIVETNLPASLLLELYRVVSPFFGYGGKFSFNEHDVCINEEKIHMETPTTKLTLRLAQSPLTLLWGFSQGYETKLNGCSGSSSPLVSRNCQYVSRQEAILGAATELKRRFADNLPLINQINKTLIGQTMQLCLF